MFINTLPVRMSLCGKDVNRLVADTRDNLNELIEHEHASLTLAQRCSSLATGVPLFTTVMNFRHNLAANGVDAQNRSWEGMHILTSEERNNYPITVNVDDDGIDFSITAQCTGVDPLRIAQYLQVAIAGLVQAQGHEAVIDLPVLGREELDLQLQTWNHSEHDFPLDHTFHALFEQRVASHPERIAVVCGGTTLSYRELDERASRIAAALIAAGAGQDSLVTLMSERSPVLLAMMLAVFKAGAAFLPLDVNHPAERLREIMSASGSTLALVSDTCVPMLEQCATGLHGIAVEPIWQHGAAPVLPALGAPDDLAYVIFTSGSTGKPKGAMVEQRGMINHMFGKIVTMRIDEHDCLAQTASPAFDICVWQFLSALLVGGRVDILEDEIAYDPTRLLSAVESHGITLLQTVPSMMRSLLDVCPADITLDGLRWMIPTGEALTLNITQEWFERFPAIGLMNVYGPAECSDDVTYQAITKRPAEHSVIPIGRPTPNNRIYLLDRHLRPVPLGVNGEICVAGTGVGRGYLNNPEQTAAAFIAHPLAQGGRFYRTGDVGRYRADGVIEFMGRIDHQVKIRGFRIEPGEVEAKLSSCDGVREAVVLVREDQPGEKRLVAYLVAQQGAQPTPLALREQMLALLADYMVPSAFVVLDTFPLTPNGKLDRRALPAPDTAALVLQQYEAPQGETEIAIAAIWRELLGLEQVGRNDHFFELGGHSLQAVQMVSRLRQHFGFELALRDLFSQPTLSAIALMVGQRRDSLENSIENLSEKSDQQSVIGAADRSLPLPLSWAQQSLWLLDQIGQSGAAYHMPAALRMKGTLDLAILQSVMDRIVSRHEDLRTHFVLVEGQAQQVIAPAHVGLSLSSHDLSALAGAEQDAAVDRICIDEALAPFHLATGPLIRGSLLKLALDEHILLITQHHIISDGWSLGVVVREFSTLYRAFTQGEADPLPPLPLQYADYAVWQRQRLSAEVIEGHLDFWRNSLADAPALLELPTDRPRPATRTYAGNSIPFTLPKALASKLRQLSERHSCTLFMSLLGGWSALLARLSGQDDVVIGTPVANRPRRELEELIGFFVNTLALRIRLPASMTVAGLLAQIKAFTLDAHAHQELPFEQLVDAIRPQRSMSYSPLFQSMLTMNNVPNTGTLELPGMNLSIIEHASTTTHFDLHLTLTDLGDAIAGSITYASDLFDARTIQRFIGHFMQLLEGMAADDGQTISHLPVLDRQQRQQLLIEFNDTARAFPDQKLIHQLFEEQVRLQPEASALVLAESRLSFAQLNHRANQVAHRLLALGIAQEDRVAICVERSIEMIVGILGVMKAGAAYVPMEPGNPQERLEHMLNDSNAIALLTQQELSSRFSALDVPVFDLDGSDFANQPKHDPDLASLGLTASNLAYVIYTSGSTGAAKGVAVEHRSAVNFWKEMQTSTHKHVTQHARIALNASFAFDMSLKGILQLLSGHCLYLVPALLRTDGSAFLDFLAQQGIDAFDCTPSQLELLLNAGLLERDGHKPTSVLIGGEAINESTWRKLKNAQHIRFYNMYGPTECTVDATITHISGETEHPTIGKPIGNARIYILDEHGQLVPQGGSGEIHIAGTGLARGYLNRAELTASRFIADPFDATPGARMYKTGDLGRWMENGYIEYLGRNDFQVKVRGFRIELGEIESHLLQVPGVREAIVLAREDQPGDKRLVAYLIAAEYAELQIADIRAQLAATLAEYMVPTAFVVLDAFPLNANGKLDRPALPMPDKSAMVAAEFEEPQGELESAIAAIWQDLLNLPSVSRHDEFFLIGGHSILAVQLLHRLRDSFEVDIPMASIFQNPTVTLLAQVITEARIANFSSEDVDRMSADLDDLSEEELIRLLNQKTD